VPYRIDLAHPPDDALERLVLLGALDIEAVAGGLAALMPDGVAPEPVANALATNAVSVSPARGRDDGSVWILSPRPVRVGRLLIAPAGAVASPGVLRLADGPAFGTGLHVTTALCLETLESMLEISRPARVLDIGTGSGVLALAALMHGVERAVGLDIDGDALRVASKNARINGLATRLHLVRGGPDAVSGAWPVVLANVLAASLVEMAALVVRRVGHGGRVVLSGIPASVAADVEQAYRHLGMRQLRAETRAGWTALVLAPSW
jgi:ribosomal protein L11 methyltransferase